MVKLSRIEQNLRKSRNFHPSKLIHYTVAKCFYDYLMKVYHLSIIAIYQYLVMIVSIKTSDIINRVAIASSCSVS